MPLPRITITGNLTADPEIRFTQSGTAIASLRVASSDRRRDKDGNWSDGEPCFLNVTVWKQIGENVANSLEKGDAVIVSGRLKQRTYTRQDGQDVTVYEMEADDIGASLARATVKVQRTAKPTPPTDDPWGDDIPPF